MISIEELQTIAPAAFTSTPAAHTSDRYQHVRTADIVERMLDDGFVITHASQQKTQNRSAHKAPHQKHRIRMRMPVNGEVTEMHRKLGNIFPTVDLINSGDWSSQLILAVGLYRVVCENGLISPFGNQNTMIKIRHDRITEDTTQAISQAVEAAPSLFEFAEACSHTYMKSDEVREYASQAARLRWGMNEDVSPVAAHIEGLMRARRVMDDKSDLWSVFNTVQENGTRGGFKVPDTNGKMRRLRSRSNIAQDVDWNQELWNLTNDMQLALS